MAEGLREVRLVAAVQGLSEQHLLRAVAALAEGGMQAVELAFTSVRNASPLVHTLKGEGLLVGVGAITRSPQARESGMLGADFIAAAVTAPAKRRNPTSPVSARNWSATLCGATA